MAFISLLKRVFAISLRTKRRDRRGVHQSNDSNPQKSDFMRAKIWQIIHKFKPSHIDFCRQCASLLLAVMYSLTAQNAICQSSFAFVDIEKILIQSNAAHLGREHIKAVRTNLENGYTELDSTLANLPEQQKQKEMMEAARALNQQLELERAAVNRVITNMMMEEIKTYRINNKLDMVLPKQVILDADGGLDITSQIIKAMNAKKPTFGKLPIVQIQKQAKPTAKPAPNPPKKK